METRARTTDLDHRQESSLGRGRLAGEDSRQGRGKQPEQESPGDRSRRQLGFWLRLLLVMFLVNLFFYGPFFLNLLGSQSATINLPYSQFLQQVNQGNVSSVTIRSDNSVTGTLKKPMSSPGAGSRSEEHTSELRSR